MKQLITAALALSLLGGAVMAQDHDRHDGGGRGGEQRDGGWRGGGRDGGGRPSQGAPQVQQPQVQQPQVQQPQFQQNVPRNRSGQPVFQGNGGYGGGDRRFEGRDGDRRSDNRGPDRQFDGRGGDRRFEGRDGDRRFDGRDNDRRPDFDRRGGDRRPDFDRGRSDFRPGGYLRDRGWRGGAHFRGPAYRYPRGFGYQYFGFGSFLPSVFFAPDYTLGAYWTYGLPAPPQGYHWIRVGPDALLVRFGDGYVLDAAYGLFY